MHTDHTLGILDKNTASIGKQCRSFAYDVCPKFDTRELPREADARNRRASKKPDHASSSVATRKPKKFNLQTYKYHSLGDYADTIRQYGTCDSYSTEPASADALWVPGTY
jgi:hypothetical protein